MSQPAVCFVTDELHPFTPGGIGRLIHNLLRREIRLARTEVHVLLPDYLTASDSEIAAVFGRELRVHRARMRSGREPLIGSSGIYPPVTSFDSVAQAQSLDLMLAARELTRQHALAVIEFPDYRGWAFSSLNEKRLGGGFSSTTIAVRLHTTAAIIGHHDRKVVRTSDVAVHELERLALQDADLVVGHLAPVVDETAVFFGFDAEWRKRVVLELPPVSEHEFSTSTGRSPPKNPELLFCTKLQPIKRPDLFLRASVALLKRRPDFACRVVLACRSEEPEYAAGLRRLVPVELEHRFVFSDSPALREELLGTSVVVVPSDFEGFNLTAYEASAAGGTLVLNERCPSFARSGTPWIDGDNCHLFDGTVEGLVGALERALDHPHPRRVRAREDPPYWLALSPGPPLGRPRSAEPRVSVIITNYNLGAYLPETLRSVAQIQHPNIETILVDDCSTHEIDRSLLLELRERPGLRVVRNEVNRGLAASRNIGVRHASGEFVLPLDADDCLAPEFVGTAVRALQNYPQVGVVVPTAAYFDDRASLEERVFRAWACFLGAAPTLGLLMNRFGCATSLIRRSLVLEHEYDERLSSYEDWDLYLRFAVAGVRFLVTNDVQFFYRARHGSMIKGVDRRRHYALLRELHGKVLGAGSAVSTDALIAHLADLEIASEEFPLRYRLVDWLNTVAKRAPVIHPLLKRMLSGRVEQASSR